MCSVQYLREVISERLTAAAEEIFTEFEKTIVQYEEEIDRQRRLLDIIWKPQIPLHTIDLPQHYACAEQELLTDQQLCDKDRNSSLEQEDSGSPPIKEEQEELCTHVDQEDRDPLQIKEEQEEICTSVDQDDLEPPQIKEEQEELYTSLGQETPEFQQIKAEHEEPCTSQEIRQIIVKQETDTFLVTPAYEESDHSDISPMSESHCESDADSPSSLASLSLTLCVGRLPQTTDHP
ncbi:serine/threonine-protein phosphatase 4 regulatory subunit 2-A-like, partial [Stegastes partitus]|uniref:Serine/threonine-protein phosphatase 4 regulatory subunit 2-A-like n=1 Tax=Stegastes partitus TaxID=144197 RepID=A0A9Y4MUQ9_9TELE